MQDKTKIFKTALNLHMAGKAKEALKLYLKLIKGNHHNDKLLFLIGTSYLQIDEYDKAIHYLDNSIKINSKFQKTKIKKKKTKFLLKIIIFFMNI